MGTDIRAYIETGGGDIWYLFAGPLPLDRNHNLFTVLRLFQAESQPPMPRGIPDNLSPGVETHYWIPVYEGEGPVIKNGISEELADEWINKHKAKSKPSYGYTDIKKWVGSTAVYGESWLTFEELRSALEVYCEEYEEEIDLYWKATLASMEVFGKQCRFVYWFDY